MALSWLLREGHASNALFVVLGPISGAGSVEIEAIVACFVTLESQKLEVDGSPCSMSFLLVPPAPPLTYSIMAVSVEGMPQPQRPPQGPGEGEEW